MTKIMKGGIAYNSTANMVALTQIEYDALTTAQKNNGNFYFITDADPSYFSAENIDYDNTDSGLTATNVQDAVDEIALGVCNYSLSEKIVGKWVDNKTLYEKTIDITPITTDSSWHSVAHGISNIDKVVYVNGIIINNNNEFVPMPNIRPAQTLDNLPVGIEVNADKTNIRYMNNWLNNITYCWVTIRYTKTV